MDVTGEVAAHGNFSSFHAVDSGITTRADARDGHFQAGHKTQVHEMLGYRKRELEFGENGFFAHAQISESAGRAASPFPFATEYEVENHFQFQLYSNSFPAHSND